VHKGEVPVNKLSMKNSILLAASFVVFVSRASASPGRSPDLATALVGKWMIQDHFLGMPFVLLAERAGSFTVHSFPFEDFGVKGSWRVRNALLHIEPKWWRVDRNSSWHRCAHSRAFQRVLNTESLAILKEFCSYSFFTIQQVADDPRRFLARPKGAAKWIPGLFLDAGFWGVQEHTRAGVGNGSAKLFSSTVSNLQGRS